MFLSWSIFLKVFEKSKVTRHLVAYGQCKGFSMLYESVFLSDKRADFDLLPLREWLKILADKICTKCLRSLFSKLIWLKLSTNIRVSFRLEVSEFVVHALCWFSGTISFILLWKTFWLFGVISSFIILWNISFLPFDSCEFTAFNF